MINDELMLQKAIENPNFLCQSGSRLYGTALPGSDDDVRGFTLAPFSYLIGIKEFSAKELGEDTKVYNLQSFLKLALRGDSQISELFFSPEKFYIKRDEIAKTILSLREKIISNAIFGRIIGYSVGEWRKAMAIKIVSKEKRKEKDQIINEIRNLYSPNKEQMDAVISALDNMDQKEVVSSVSGLGIKRKNDVDEFGFCRKSAAHSIRLVSQLIELMDTGKMTFPRPEADLLLDIRNGKYKKEELDIMYKDVVSKAENIKSKSVLRNKPDENFVWNMYSQIVLEYIKKLNSNIGDIYAV